MPLAIAGEEASSHSGHIHFVACGCICAADQETSLTSSCAAAFDG